MNFSVRDPRTGEWNDIILRKRSLPHGYVIHWGSRKLGHLLQADRSGWVAQSYANPSKVVGGFRTCRAGIAYILKLDGYWPWMSNHEWDEETQEWYDPSKRLLEQRFLQKSLDTDQTSR